VRTTKDYRIDPLSCAYCAKCHSICPTYETTGNEGFAARGKILLASAMRGDLRSLPLSALGDPSDNVTSDWHSDCEVNEYLNFCLRCYRCLEVCPSTMATVPIFEAMRFDIARKHPPPLHMQWLMRSVLAERGNTRLISGIGALPFSLIPWAAKQVSVNDKLRSVIDKLSRNHRASVLSARSPTLFLGKTEFPLPVSAIARGRAYDYIRNQQKVAQPERGIIGYFLDCLTDIHFPGAFAGTVRLLNSLGFRVDTEFKSPCCGASALNTGDEKAFEKMARSYARLFAAAPYDRILFTNPTCYKTVKERYPEILGDKELARLPEPVLDVELYDELPAPSLNPAWRELNIAWHNPCTLGYALGDKTTALTVLQKWGMRVSEFPEVEGCCGYGGMFYLRYPEFAAEQSARKLKTWQDAEIDLALTCSAGCIGHINATAIREKIPIPTIHWGELG